MLSLQTNVAALRGQNSLVQTQSMLNRSLQRLSTGHRINSAQDDAAGLGISENLRAETRSLQQAVRNANDGMSVINVAEGAMQEIGNILVRMRELAVQGASDTVGSTERGFLNEEVTALKSEVDRIVNVTNFNGQNLIDGSISATGMDFQIGVDNNADSKLSLTVSDVGQTGLGISAAAVDTKASAQTALSTIDTAITSLSTQRSKLGAYGNRLQSSINNLNVSIENLTAAHSAIRDVDVASETAEMARSQVLVQSGVAMLAQANQAPQQVLRLLG